MYISSRLMAAYDLAEGITIHVGNSEEQPGNLHYVIEDKGKVIDEGHDLRVPMLTSWDKATITLLHFLDHYAEHYRMHDIGPYDVDDDSPGTAEVREWCYMNETEIQCAIMDLGGYDS